MDKIEIIENSKKSKDKYGHCYGSSTVILNISHIKALKGGKLIAFNDGEYTTFLEFENLKNN